MTKYYIYTTIAIIAIIALQAMYVYNMYDSFIESEGTKIEKSIDKALDIECYRRSVLSHSDTVSYEVKFTKLEDMTKQQRDSLIAIRPIPSASPQTYDLAELMSDGRIKSFSNFYNLSDQDRLFEIGSYTNASSLDSILIAQNGKDYHNNIYVYDNTNTLLSSCSNIKEGVISNYQSGLISVSLKGYQFIKVETFIPASNFIKQAYYILILSLLTSLIPLGILIYLTTTIRRRNKESKIRELSINGVIHDLKSPLAGLGAMLDFFRITETDQNKVKIINSNKENILLLTQRIKILLSRATNKNKSIPINKELTTLSDLIERTERIKMILLQKKWRKNINISLIKLDDREVNIDTLHYDTVIMNLIENSIKYSTDDVEIKVKLSVKNNHFLVINVKDNGLGVNRRDFKKIFNPDFDSPHKNIEGYCIGLSYVLAIAKAHNGSAYLIDSTKGIGSEFEVIFNAK